MMNCQLCGKPIRSDNATGYCQRTFECKQAYMAAFQRPCERRPTYCLGCGKRVSPNVFVCTTSTACYSLSQRLRYMLRKLEVNEVAK